MKEIFFSLPLPPSVNSIYSLRVVAGVATQYKNKVAKEFEQEAGSAILTQRAKQLPASKLIGTLYMAVHLYFPDRRRRDTDNPHKILQDVVSETLDFDDSRIGEVHIYRHYDKENPRAEVLLGESDKTE